MHVLIVGASGGIGLETITRSLVDGHQVRAFSRSSDQLQISNPKLEKWRGNALNLEEVENALDGIDVVIQVLGVKTSELFRPINLFSDSTRIIVSAMERLKVKRLIAVTGFGSGDSRKAINCLQRVPFHFFLGRAYADKDIQEHLIISSQLDWTLVRPGVLTSGRFSGNYKIISDPSEWRNGIISRADVADFLVKQMTEIEYLRLAPVLVNR